MGGGKLGNSERNAGWRNEGEIVVEGRREKGREGEREGGREEGK